ncbi:hypothetical protein LCGC14_0643510 [marine sediment metagenome]|uniref:Uncharacterized protein n=1 Tax=marine sediment metagenome TaxID=412755 RepID=A0A0F9QYL9_9ZZZZ
MGSKCGKKAGPQPGLNASRQVLLEEYFEKRKAKEGQKNSRELEAKVVRLQEKLGTLTVLHTAAICSLRLAEAEVVQLQAINAIVDNARLSRNQVPSEACSSDCEPKGVVLIHVDRYADAEKLYALLAGVTETVEAEPAQEAKSDKPPLPEYTPSW